MHKLVEHVIDEINARQLAGLALAGTLAVGQPAVADASTMHHKHRTVANHTYSEDQIIRAIAGEAGGSGYEGMLAIAGAIRNRQHSGEYKHNILKHVAGLHAKHLAHDPQVVFTEAKRAWYESATNNIIPGATLWGNRSDVHRWETEPGLMDMSKLDLVKEVGGNYFFKYR